MSQSQNIPLAKMSQVGVMEDAKHSPAPWELDGAIIRTDERPVCEIYRELTSSPATLANAALISAAPELFAALKWFIDDIDGTHTKMVDFDANVTAARAAIAKASAS